MNIHSLLTGNIKHQLLFLAFPLLMGNILQQLYNTVDAFIIGRCLGTLSFAAVGLSGTIMNLFIFILNGFCGGISILSAQFYGMGNIHKFRQQFALSISAGLSITVLLSAIALAFLHPLLKIMQTPEHVLPYAYTYLTIILAGLFSTYLYNLLSGILRAIGDTTASLLFLLLSILLNTALDILFIVCFHMGISGAAYATVIAQACSALSCYCYLLHKYPHLVCRKADFILDIALLNKMLCYGGVSALQQSSLYIGKMLIQGAVNSLGASAIVSYTATMRIEGMVNAFGDSGSQAISVLVAQNHGAGNRTRAKQSFQYGLFFLVLSGVLLSAVMYVTAPFGVAFLVGSTDVSILHFGVQYLKVISLFYIFCYIGSAFVGYFRGIGKVTIPFIATTIHITLRVILSYLWITSFQLPAVALASGLGWICAVLIHYCFYRFFHSSNLQS